MNEIYDVPASQAAALIMRANRAQGRRRNERAMLTVNAPAAIQALAGGTPVVLVSETPDGEPRFRFIVDGRATIVPPASL